MLQRHVECAVLILVERLAGSPIFVGYDGQYGPVAIDDNKIPPRTGVLCRQELAERLGPLEQ